jgi:hypothetical protein
MDLLLILQYQECFHEMFQHVNGTRMWMEKLCILDIGNWFICLPTYFNTKKKKHAKFCKWLNSSLAHALFISCETTW